MITSEKFLCSIILYTIDCGSQWGVVSLLGVYIQACLGIFLVLYGHPWWRPWQGCYVGLWCEETGEAAKCSLMHRTALTERVILPKIPIEPRLEKPCFLTMI